MLATEFSADDSSAPAAVGRISESATARVVDTSQERRVWIDTHDWILYRAGLLLEQRARGSERLLLLSDLGGNPLGRAPAGKRPVTERTLPEGPIRERVGPLTGLRALLPRLAAEGPASILAVLDAEEKTVARIAVDGPFAVAGTAGAVTRVRVETLRGYGKDADRVEGVLAATPGLAPAGSSLFAALAGNQGLTPGVHRSKPDSRFSAKAPAGEVFADTFRQLLEIVQDNVDGTLRELDTEFLHDFRVAVRRGRSVLKAADGVVAEPVRAKYSAELKWLGDATSVPRDLDVQLLDFGAGLSAVDVTAAEPFRLLLERRCRKSHGALNRALRTARFGALLSGWAEELARPVQGGPTATKPVGRVAHDLLSRTWLRVGKLGSSITPESPAESLHDLRKRCKELRYLLEFFGCLYDPRAHKAIVDELKQLQDNLGEFQDFEAQWFLVRDCAIELRGTDAPIETLLTMGLMAHDLRHRQEAARADFAARWSRFHDKENRARFAAMVAAR
jgi:CHAD domain-containing protein